MWQRTYKQIIAAVICGLASLALAQFDHDLDIGIPNYIGLKIIDSAGDIASDPSVNFDFESNPAPYLAAVSAGGDDLSPTSVDEFVDIQVRRTGFVWSVWTRSTVVSGFGATSGLSVSDISVDRGSVSGLTPSSAFSGGFFFAPGFIDTDWQLSTSWQRIARGYGATSGWDSLGFNGEDYLLTIDGDETPGEHVLLVQYLMIGGF